MSPVTFTTYTTNQLSKEQLISLVKNFNTVFEKDFTVAQFEQQYNFTVKGFSYHSLMEQDGEVVGACSAVPYEYMYNADKKIFGLLVGLFVVKEFRKDPFALYKIYSKLKDLMIEDGVSVTMAVPNHNSYPYFKHVLKWKDIGNLPYYALPVRFGNIKKTNKWLNIFSWLFAHSASRVSKIKNIISNNTERKPAIYLLPNEPIMENHRYSTPHKIIKQNEFSLFYRTDLEEGIRTAYIIDFYNSNNIKDARSLAAAVSFILNNDKPDIILFIGRLTFSQLSLIKVPIDKEPKKLNFCAEVLNKKEIGNVIYDMESWDFGLYNFDVR